MQFARDARERLAPAGLDLEYHEHGGGHSIDPDTVPAIRAWFDERVASFARRVL